MSSDATPRWRFESALTALDDLDYHIARDRTEAADADFITNRPWVIVQRDPHEGFDQYGRQEVDIELRVKAETTVTQTWLRTVERVMQQAGFQAGIVGGSVMLFAPQFTWQIPSDSGEVIRKAQVRQAHEMGTTPAAAALDA